MALEKYKAKRNFAESPEPTGDTPRKSPAGRAPRFFCVQKHLASHLHYDFRLEHNGVLLSWAVPKGPSLDPKTKRLAMMVEDHPIEYGEFEGVIPSGYGAGIVMLWDVGTWVPEVDDVDGALRKGDLKLTLNGFKLKGSWVLVRTRDARTWLLIKHRDDWAGDVNITEFAPHSVKSSGDFADILAQENPAIWISHRPAEGGETGAMFKRIVERALEMRGQASGSSGSSVASGSEPSSRSSRSARPSGATRSAPTPRATRSAPTAARTSKSGAAKSAKPAKATKRKATKRGA